MVSVNYNNFNVYSSGKVNNTLPEKTVVTQPAVHRNCPSFGNIQSDTDKVRVRTELITKDEKKKYNEIAEALEGSYRKKLNQALKSGKLLKNNSADKS